MLNLKRVNSSNYQRNLIDERLEQYHVGKGGIQNLEKLNIRFDFTTDITRYSPLYKCSYWTHKTTIWSWNLHVISSWWAARLSWFSGTLYTNHCHKLLERPNHFHCQSFPGCSEWLPGRWLQLQHRKCRRFVWHFQRPWRKLILALSSVKLIELLRWTSWMQRNFWIFRTISEAWSAVQPIPWPHQIESFHRLIQSPTSLVSIAGSWNWHSNYFQWRKIDR